jgi:K+-transporting ATPase ATPase C chain
MLTEIARELRPAAVVFLMLTIVTGVIYPFAVTGISAVLFPDAARGSLIEKDGQWIGSRLIGQPFEHPGYFWGRPSATGPYSYNAGASSGSNLGPLNEALQTAVRDRVASLKSADPEQSDAPPIDLVTASGSGLDPHISPAAAFYQAGRVAKARNLSKDRVEELVRQHVEPRTLGLLGEPRVNVLVLNLALDELSRRQ